MSYTNGLDKPTDYFNAVLWEGNNTAGRQITGVGFEPDLVWLKNRTSSANHGLHTQITGVDGAEYLRTNGTNAITTSANHVTSFDSDGFTINNGLMLNDTSNNYVAWNWKAGGSASSNTDGSITSSVSVNQTAGISIGTFTGTASVGTVGHGLNAVPSMIINRTITAAKDWMTYHHKNTSAPETDYLALNSTNATADFEDVWNDTDPTSSLFTIGDSSQNNTGSGPSIFYAFAEKKGFSKFGSYTGNGNADGTFVYTGFSPSFVMLKRTNTTGSWTMYDNKRHTYNPNGEYLLANNSSGGIDFNNVDFLSNGFKLRDASFNNGSGDTIIYMCFAESPFTTSTGIPTVAR